MAYVCGSLSCCKLNSSRYAAFSQLLHTPLSGITLDNIGRLKNIFPDAFTEGSVNFDALRQLLGDAKVIDEGEEKYGLNWQGKKKARQIALTPSTGALLPCPEESVDWDTTPRRQGSCTHFNSQGAAEKYSCRNIA